MLRERSELIPRGLTASALAVADLHGGGRLALVIAGSWTCNRVLRLGPAGLEDATPELLADPDGPAVGLAAADLDGDGREELLIVNSDSRHGPKRASDRLLASRGAFVDLFALPVNREVRNRWSGHALACLDRLGRGIYGLVVGTLGGPIRLFELEGDAIVDRAADSGIDEIACARALLAAPLLGGPCDLVVAAERGPNLAFRARGDGSFEELAEALALADPDQDGRALAMLDANGDGALDLLLGNDGGPLRLLLRGYGRFLDAAPLLMAAPARVRAIVVADLDNDGHEEIFVHNHLEPNRLFGWREGGWRPIDVGQALGAGEPAAGALACDLDGDGRLELLLARGEDGALACYRAECHGGWLRVLPRTRFGAPARGALVRLESTGRVQQRVIEAAGGRAQGEPVAHFGLGSEWAIERVEVIWPDGARARVERPAACQLLQVPYPGGSARSLSGKPVRRSS